MTNPTEEQIKGMAKKIHKVYCNECHINTQNIITCEDFDIARYVLSLLGPAVETLIEVKGAMKLAYTFGHTKNSLPLGEVIDHAEAALAALKEAIG